MAGPAAREVRVRHRMGHEAGTGTGDEGRGTGETERRWRLNDYGGNPEGFARKLGSEAGALVRCFSLWRRLRFVL